MCRTRHHISLFRTAIAWLVIGLALSPLTANSAEELKVQNFQDWSVRCRAATDNSPRACELFQRIVHKESGQQLVQLAFAYQQADEQPVALALLPLGIHLPSGVGLQVDQGDAIKAAVQTCTAQGCQVLLPVGDKLLASLKAGLTLRIAFLEAASRRQITIPMSLKGFSAGIKALRATR